MKKPIVFISHITEEAHLASILKRRITKDFLQMVDVFVSSDSESIPVGRKWLASIEKALGEASIELILCSQASVKRPWINFEAGAGWIRGIPIVPVCHSGLPFAELIAPLNELQAIHANDQTGLRRIYQLISNELGAAEPLTNFDELKREVLMFEQSYAIDLSEITRAEAEKEKVALERMLETLRKPSPKWRTIERLAFKAAVSQSEAADILRKTPEIVLDKGRDGKQIATLRSKLREVSPGIPALSIEAQELLKEASMDPHGTILYVRHMGGTEIQTNGKSLIVEQTPRVIARWEAALSQLKNSQLIAEKGRKGEVFQVTDLGFRTADILKL